MQSLIIHAASPATGRAILAALVPFRAEMLEDGDGHCEVAVRLEREDSEVVAVLNALERYVIARSTGPATAGRNGRRNVLYAGPGDLTG